MTEKTPMTVVQVSTSDLGGGAERIASDLHRASSSRGISSLLAVGHQFDELPGTVLIPNDERRTAWARSVLKMQPGISEPHADPSASTRFVRRAIKTLAEPGRAWKRSRGYEDFEFPGTYALPDIAGRRADVIHLHNLHGGYFDLRALPEISRTVPTVMTPHDTWVAAGHCAYPLDCERWLTGCGECPYLDTIPAVPRDETAKNWTLKRDIYLSSRIHIAAPSRWVLDRLERSIFAEAIVSSRVIPNAVDHKVFKPGDRRATRDKLGLPQAALVLIFSTANGRNRYKDFPSVLTALPEIAHKAGEREVVLIGLGAEAMEMRSDNTRVLPVPYLSDPTQVAGYIKVADVCIHAAHAENHPLAIIEAQSCGVPVVASDVGGVSEIIVDGETGTLVPAGDPSAMASAVAALLLGEARRREMGKAAADRAARLFGLDRMVDDYVDLYASLAQERKDHE